MNWIGPILDQLKSGDKNTHEIADAIGESRWRTATALASMAKSGRIFKTKRGIPGRSESPAHWSIRIESVNPCSEMKFGVFRTDIQKWTGLFPTESMAQEWAEASYGKGYAQIKEL